MKGVADDRHSCRFPFRLTVGLEIWEHGAVYCCQEVAGVDLSSEGGGLATQYPLQKGDLVKLLIPVGEINLRLPVYAEVAWSRQSNDGFRAGVTFLA